MTFAADLFTDTDGTLLDAHTATDGGTWTKRAGSGATTLTINNNRVNSTSNASNAYYYHSGTPAAADYSVQGDVTMSAGTVVSPFVAGRMVTGTTTNYQLGRISGGWRIDKVSAGTRTTIGTFSDAATPSAVTMILRMTGTTIVGNIAGVDQISVTDAAIAGAGKAGCVCQSSDSGTTRFLDNFSASDPASGFTANFRKTLSSFGSGVGKRQAY